MTRTLLDISRDMEVLDGLLAEVDMSIAAAEGEVSVERLAALEAVEQWKKDLGTEFTEKIDNIAAFVRSLELRAAARREEMERLQKRVKVDENNAKWLKNMVMGELQAREIKKLDTRRYKIGVAGNGGLQPLIIDMGAPLPPEFTFVPPPEWDKQKVRKALAEGRDVPGAALLPRGTHLSIR